MIFANHAHIFPKEIRPEGTVEKLLELMDECGIDMAVCYPPFHDRFRESGFEGDPNDWLAEEIKGNPRLIGFGNIDFEKGDFARQVEKLASLGFKGIKMHPPYQEFVIDGPEASEVYAKAEELGLFISFHSGMHWHRLRDNRVILFDEVAWRFPKLKFSMEHIGGYHFYREALAVMCNNSRNGNCVYAGWTSVGLHKGKDSVWALSDEELERVIHQTGEERSIFGLDFPYNNAEVIRADIARIRALDISDECKENILGLNLKNALGI